MGNLGGSSGDRMQMEYRCTDHIDEISGGNDGFVVDLMRGFAC